MTVNHFFIPGHATRRDFAIYAVIARKIEGNDWRIYVGKTGDNRQGCNPVVSRAGNHFSYNDVHSQVRNKLLPSLPHDFNFDYFYVSFNSYLQGKDNRDSINSINEMERLAIDMVKDALPAVHRHRLLNPRAGTGYVPRIKQEERETLRTADSVKKIKELADAVAQAVGQPGGA